VALVTAKLRLSNPRFPTLAEIEVDALADTGSVFLCIPEHVRLQLKLEALETREVKLADGSRATYPYVGPIVLSFKNRTDSSARSCSATRYCSARFRWKRWISSWTRAIGPST
jgi:hypothetical protein